MSSVWHKIKYFNPNENWGDVYRIDDRLLILLDEFRESIHCPIIVLCGTQGEHSSLQSYHYIGKAVDIVCPYTEKSLFDVF